LNKLARKKPQPTIDVRADISTKKLAVACVLKDGPDFDVGYVEKLYNGCKRSLTVEHDMFCLTDKMDMDMPCNKVELRHYWPGWWSKIELFRPDVFEAYERVIYFDLDTVLVSEINDLAFRPCRFAMVRGYRKPERRSSTIMVWEGDFSKIYYDMVKKENRVLADPKAWDQRFITACLRDYYCEPDLVQDMIPGVLSYKNNIKETGELPEEATIICFHGKPRPLEVEHDWMKEFWS
jgi:hypothetical protein